MQLELRVTPDMTLFKDRAATVPAEVGGPIGCVAYASGDYLVARCMSARPQLVRRDDGLWIVFDNIDDELIRQASPAQLQPA